MPFNLCELTDTIKFRWVPRMGKKKNAIYESQKGPNARHLIQILGTPHCRPMWNVWIFPEISCGHFVGDIEGRKSEKYYATFPPHFCPMLGRILPEISLWGLLCITNTTVQEHSKIPPPLNAEIKCGAEHMGSQHPSPNSRKPLQLPAASFRWPTSHRVMPKVLVLKVEDVM